MNQPLQCCYHVPISDNKRVKKLSTKPVLSQSPASPKRTSDAMFALLNSKLELLTGGEDAILQKMVGNDIWIVDKKCRVGGNDNSRP